MTSNVALNVRCWGKKLIFALKQICKMSWANLNLATSDSNVMLGKCFFMAMMLSIKEFCLHFIFKLYWFYPNDWNAWYDLFVIKSLLFFTMLMDVALTGHLYVYICLQILWSWLANSELPQSFSFHSHREKWLLDFCFILQLSAVWKGGTKFAKFGFTKLHGFTAGKSCKCAQICHLLLFDN